VVWKSCGNGCAAQGGQWGQWAREVLYPHTPNNERICSSQHKILKLVILDLNQYTLSLRNKATLIHTTIFKLRILHKQFLTWFGGRDRLCHLPHQWWIPPSLLSQPHFISLLSLHACTHYFLRSTCNNISAKIAGHAVEHASILGFLMTFLEGPSTMDDSQNAASLLSQGF